MRQRPGAKSRSEAVPRARQQESSFRGPVSRSRAQHAAILGSHIKRSRTFNKRNPRPGGLESKETTPTTYIPRLALRLPNPVHRSWTPSEAFESKTKAPRNEYLHSLSG